MPDKPSLSAGQAVVRWVLHVVIFLLAGGIAAGVSALAYNAVSPADNPLGMYAIIFAAGGLIAYRLTEQVLDTPDR